MFLRMKRLYGTKSRVKVKKHVDMLRTILSSIDTPCVKLVHKRLGEERLGCAYYNVKELIDMSNKIGRVGFIFKEDKPFVDLVAKYINIQSKITEDNRDDYALLLRESKELYVKIQESVESTKPEIVI